MFFCLFPMAQEMKFLCNQVIYCTVANSRPGLLLQMVTVHKPSFYNKQYENPWAYY